MVEHIVSDKSDVGYTRSKIVSWQNPKQFLILRAVIGKAEII